MHESCVIISLNFTAYEAWCRPKANRWQQERLNDVIMERHVDLWIMYSTTATIMDNSISDRGHHMSYILW